MKVRKNKYDQNWSAYFQGDCIGCWRTPKESKHKARMWYMWITTGDESYLRKEV